MNALWRLWRANASSSCQWRGSCRFGDGQSLHDPASHRSRPNLTRDTINIKAGLQPAPHYVPGGEEGTNLAAFDERDYRKRDRAREQARLAALIDIVGYEDIEGNPVDDDDPDGWPVFSGYERIRERRPASETFKDFLAKINKG